MEEVKLTLSVAEVNMILKALGQFPYNQVNELIGKVQAQATEDLKSKNGQQNKQKELTH
ncbi:MAG: hypothetical protein MI810_02365 [Flavobacteriales bacterium]|jgi:hypothetical protein|nr:hypothetical protein [Flavobacteriales bacterium]